MDGSLFPDGVLVTSDALQYDSNAKAGQILKDRVNLLERGLRSGMLISVNPVNTQRIDITLGDGSAPNGERVTLPQVALPSFGALNVPIADTSLGALNYVYVFYTETFTKPMPHETNGKAPKTRRTPDLVVRVLTAAQFSALPISDPTYASLSQDRGMLIGVVTGTGGALLPSSIQQPAEWRALKYSTLLPPSISGISIMAVSDATPTGTNGLIVLDTTGPITLAWQAPGEAGPGATVTITAEGPYVLTSLGGSTIQVYVVPGALPAASSNMGVAITGIYDQSIPRESGTDRHHRSLVGSGTPTPQNPHGTSIDDIAPGFVDELRNHQRFAHSTGIYKGSNAGCLGGTILEASAPDQFQVQAPTGVDAYYVDGKRLTAITNSQISWTDGVPGPNKELYEVYVDSIGNVAKSKRLSWNNLVTNIPNVENLIVFVNGAVPTGLHTITYRSNGPGLGGTLEWDGGNTRTQVDPIPVGGAYYQVRNGAQEIGFFFGDNGSINGLAAGIYSDQVTVNGSVESLLAMVTAQVAWTGSATGGLGYTANRGVIQARFVDVRPRGTVDGLHIRENFIVERTELPLWEHSPDGVVIGGVDAVSGSLRVSASAGLTINVVGSAPVYVGGKRFVVNGLAGYALPNNDISLVYVDQGGAIQVVSFLTAPAFLFDPKQAAWNHPDSTVRRGAALAIVTTVGGVITDVIDMRRNLSGGNVTVKPYSVGSTVPGRDNYSAEFMDLSAAIIYAGASAGGTKVMQAIELLDAVAFRPIAIGGGTSILLRGGNIWLEENALQGSLFSVVGSKLVLQEVTLLTGITLTAPLPGSSYVKGDTNADISLQGVTAVPGAAANGLQSIVEITNSLGQLDINGLRVAQQALVTKAEIIRVSATNRNIQVHDVIVHGGALAFLHANGGTVSARISKIVCDDGDVGPVAPLFAFTGAGTITNTIVTEPWWFCPPAVTPNPVVGLKVQGGFLCGSNGGASWGNLTDSVFTGVRFGSPAFADPTTLSDLATTRFIGCTFGPNGVSLVTCSNCHIGGGATSGSLDVASTCSDIVVDGFQVQGQTFLAGTNLQVRGLQGVNVSLNSLAGLRLSGSRMANLLASPILPLSDIEVTGNEIQGINLTWDNTAGNVTRDRINIHHNKITRQIRAYAVAAANPKLKNIDLRIENNDLVMDPAFPQVISLSDCSGARISGNSIFANLHNLGVFLFGTDGVGGQGFGDADISNNTFKVDSHIGPAAPAGWAYPILYIEGSKGAGTNPSGKHLRIFGNEVIALEAASNPNMDPMIFVQFVGGAASDSAIHHNHMRHADDTVAINPYNWTLPNTPLLSASRLAMVVAVDGDPLGWGGPSTGHGRNVANMEIASNRVQGTGPFWILAQVYKGSLPTPSTDVKIIFSGGLPSFIDDGGPGAAFILAND